MLRDIEQHISLPIKILFVVESFSTGVYTIIKDIACGVDPNTFHIHIIHSLRNDSPKYYAEDLKGNHITLEYVPMNSLVHYLQAIRKIRKRINMFKPHLVHLHSSKGGFLGSIAARKNDPIIYSPHGFSFLRTDVPRIYRMIFFLLEKYVRTFCGGKILCVSPGEEVEAKKITQDTALINNFIDCSLVPEAKPSSTPTVITVGRINHQKNPDLFNSIAEALPDIQFIWVGDGPLAARLQAVNITITGYVTRTEALDYLSKSWVYLQTSLWEGMPVSVLEAMAVRLPIVATNIIGNKDLVVDRETGYLHEIDKTNDFIKTIQELIQDHELRSAIGDKARRRVEEQFSLDYALQEYEKLYRGMITEL